MVLIYNFVFQFQSNEALFEAVEHQELDLVQLLLSQYSLEELDLNTPNSEGLLPLDIAIMTNNVPMAKLLLRAGAKESPHCEYRSFINYFKAIWIERQQIKMCRVNASVWNQQMINIFRIFWFSRMCCDRFVHRH